MISFKNRLINIKDKHAKSVKECEKLVSELCDARMKLELMED